ncbi:exonuclease SbcCD subunit D C-terminal domain-containing protein [uncultured Bacteroides sp.]|jgi:exonuclease SbcD|uniref:exonuclease SbcCD subunit D C-terminal domain-containing protein n=1 Tax=uncultured Bacteroides sp. TaxID=162156 RepID=UPI0025F45D64|nr:exonuclease SbcCD subunit D C-terminal domain-containing protein [uncultured Bacteroides sp.]
MIRILHTADWHLGQTFFGYDREAEQEAFLSWLAGQIHENEIDALVVAGDVFDVSNPSAAAQRMYYRFIYEVTAANPALQIVIVAGNHDSAARLEAPLPLLQAMRTEVRGVVRKSEGGEVDLDHLCVELKNRQGEAEVLCLAVPFLRQGDYPAVAESTTTAADCSSAECSSVSRNPYADGVRELYRRLIQHALLRRKAGQAVLAMGHLQATGAEIAERDYSERTVIGGLECVSPDVFDGAIAYTALGHIHKSQRVSGRENVRYAGSPLPMSFAEKNYHHGVVMVTFEDGHATDICRLACPQLVPMVSVPVGEPALPGEVLRLLKALPDRSGEAPYLEVKVLLEEPEPLLRQQIDEALAGKNYRLARIVSAYRKEEKNEKREEQTYAEGLQEMSPLQIAQSTFEKIYQSDMPDELVALFQEACRSVSLSEDDSDAR